MYNDVALQLNYIGYDILHYHYNKPITMGLKGSGGLGLRSHSVICQKGLCYFS